MKGIDLFCGAGGMSLGAKSAGIDLVFSVDNDEHALNTYRENFPESDAHLMPVEKLTESTISVKPDIIFGGPPCQGFSTSNQKTRNKENPKNWLYRSFLKFAFFMEPEWIVIENVKGLLETERRYFFNAILKAFKKNAYKTSFFIMNAAEYGIPQNRSRLFIVANRKGKEIYPPNVHKGKAVTVYEAIHDLPILRNGANICLKPYRVDATSSYAESLRKGRQSCTNNLVTKNSPIIIERYKHIKPGNNWTVIPSELMNNYKDRNRCHTGIYHRLNPNYPSVVIGNFRKNMLIHPSQNRGLSVREAARLQSFPDSFTFKGSIGFQQQQVGNAVPPRLAELVFKEIIKS